jgi:rod shape-determining protein MreD
MLKNILHKYKIYTFLTLLTIVAHLPLNFISVPVKPELIVITIFFFSIIPETRPALFFLILLGIFDDLISYSVVGISSLNYVLISLIASSNTKALLEQRFNVVWLAALISLAIVNVAEAFVLSFIYNKNHFNIEVPLVVLVSTLLYPLVHYIYSVKINLFRTKNAR